MPAYSPGTTLHIYGSVGQGQSLKGVLSGQMHSDYFPVSLGDLVSSIHVHEYRGEPFRIGDATISATYLNHPGMALGYRVERAGKTVVYATDHEPYRTTLEAGSREAEAGKQFGRVLDDAFVGFVKGADLYIGEAQYTDLEYPVEGRLGPLLPQRHRRGRAPGGRQGARPLPPRSRCTPTTW